MNATDHSAGPPRGAVADSEGRYIFRGLAQGKYTIQHPRGTPVSVDLKHEEGLGGIDLLAPRERGNTEVNVELVFEDGSPVNGAEMSLVSPPPTPVRTFLPSGNMVQLQLTADQPFTVIGRLWRDGRQWTGTSSLRLESTGGKVRLILK